VTPTLELPTGRTVNRAFRERFGETAAVRPPGDITAWWPCPACGESGPLVPVKEDDTPSHASCQNGCTTSQVIAALARGSQGSSSATQGSSSATQGSSSATQGSSSATQGSSSKPLTAHDLPCDATPDWINGLGRDEAAVSSALPALGIDAPLGQRFPCILPGHDQSKPEASIFRDPLTGLWKYRDWHHVHYGTPEWLRLADVRAALAYGVVRWRNGPEAARWYRRLWHEAGLVDPVPVELPALPPDASRALRKVAEGFALHVGLRRLREPDDEPVAFAHRFAAAWCGCTTREVGRAIPELRRLGVVRQVDEISTGGLRPMPLYLPGEAAR
jgi:hypothetical protein